MRVSIILTVLVAFASGCGQSYQDISTVAVDSEHSVRFFCESRYDVGAVVRSEISSNDVPVVGGRTDVFIVPEKEILRDIDLVIKQLSNAHIQVSNRADGKEWLRFHIPISEYDRISYRHNKLPTKGGTIHCEARRLARLDVGLRDIR